MSRGFVRLIKVGGSLFDWPELGPQLWRWLQQQPPGVNYLVAGGGELADVIRMADQRHTLGESLCHDLCLRLLTVNGAILRQLMVDAERNATTPLNHRKVEVLNVEELLAVDEVRARVPYDLPQTWEATTDTISAYLAEALAAVELVLLKSNDLPGNLSYAEASARGYVDPFFPMAMQRRASCRYVNLRSSSYCDWLLYYGGICSSASG